MSKADQDFDASGVSVANMSPEEIDAALAAMAEETAAARSESAKPEQPQQADANGQQSTGASGMAASENTPRTESIAAASDTPSAAAQADPEVRDTETALDNIDKDLAELESLLAQTEGDNISVPESIVQASSGEGKSSESPAPQQARQDGANAHGGVADADAKTGSAASATDGPGSDKTEGAEPDALPTDDKSLLGLDEVTGSTGAAAETDEASTESPSPATEAVSQSVDAEAPEESPWTLQSVLLMPLILIDKPFARFSPRFKTGIGIAGFATLVVAITTLLIGALK